MIFRPTAIFIVLLFFMTGLLSAQDEGQSLLDQATEAKIGAMNFNQLQKVVTLAEQAIDKILKKFRMEGCRVVNSPCVQDVELT